MYLKLQVATPDKCKGNSDVGRACEICVQNEEDRSAVLPAIFDSISILTSWENSHALGHKVFFAAWNEIVGVKF